MTYDEWRNTVGGQLAASYQQGNYVHSVREAALRLAFDAGLDAALAVLDEHSKRNQAILKALDDDGGGA